MRKIATDRVEYIWFPPLCVLCVGCVVAWFPEGRARIIENFQTKEKGKRSKGGREPYLSVVIDKGQCDLSIRCDILGRQRSTDPTFLLIREPALCVLHIGVQRHLSMGRDLVALGIKKACRGL